MQPIKPIAGPLKLGIIGMTEGNGHPYSWSAIFNGYNRQLMTAECPFPVIPAYLNKEDPATMRIENAAVTHIFCDKEEDARHVAACSLIPKVVKSPEQMIGQVDAVMIAADIGSQHVARAEPFVEAGVPLFIDKPLCDNRHDLQIFRRWIIGEKKPIISSSALRYGKAYIPYHRRTEELGELRLVSMTMSKQWETYGIHALEAIYPIVGPGFLTVQNIGGLKRNLVHLTHSRGIDVLIACIQDIAYGGALNLVGTDGTATLSGSDTYYAFKTQLQTFVNFLRTGKYPFPFSETDELMQLLIGGIESRENAQKIISIEPLRV